MKHLIYVVDALVLALVFVTAVAFGPAGTVSAQVVNPVAFHIRVTRVPMPGEIPCLYCGIDFEAGRSWSTNATSGLLTIYGATTTTTLAVFNKAEWSRVERIDKIVP